MRPGSPKPFSPRAMGVTTKGQGPSCSHLCPNQPQASTGGRETLHNKAHNEQRPGQGQAQTPLAGAQASLAGQPCRMRDTPVRAHRLALERRTSLVLLARTLGPPQCWCKPPESCFPPHSVNENIRFAPTCAGSGAGCLHPRVRRVTEDPEQPASGRNLQIAPKGARVLCKLSESPQPARSLGNTLTEVIQCRQGHAGSNHLTICTRC